MSRSRKKVPGFTDSNSWAKNQANRKIRKIKLKDTIGNGKNYKKRFCSYDICDWTFLMYHATWCSKEYWKEQGYKAYMK